MSRYDDHGPEPCSRCEELLDDLRDAADTLGRVPKSKDARNTDVPPYSVTTYRNHFGTWNDALRAAGFDPHHEIDISDRKLIEEIHRLRDVVGHPPTVGDLADHGKYSGPTYHYRFGGWSNALREAGYEPNLITKPPPDDMLDDMRRVAREHDAGLVQSLIADHGKFSVGVYKRVFGSWADAKRAAGLDVLIRKDITDEELIADLRRLRNELGRSPFSTEVKERGTFSLPTYHDRFGPTWGDVIDAAGMERTRYEGENHVNWIENSVRLRYGPRWPTQRKRRLEHDEYACVVCGITEVDHRERFGFSLDVHHLRKFRTFDDPERAHDLSNLLTLCRPCHRRYESMAPLRPHVAGD
jgi:hypothetical protein